VQNALLALRQLLKRFEYKAVGGRDVIHDIIEQIFPLLQGLMTSLMANTTEEASTVIKLILKVSTLICACACMHAGMQTLLFLVQCVHKVYSLCVHV
jgi:hypothetical protein